MSRETEKKHVPNYVACDPAFLRDYIKRQAEVGSHIVASPNPNNAMVVAYSFHRASMVVGTGRDISIRGVRTKEYKLR